MKRVIILTAILVFFLSFSGYCQEGNESNPPRLILTNVPGNYTFYPSYPDNTVSEPAPTSRVREEVNAIAQILIFYLFFPALVLLVVFLKKVRNASKKKTDQYNIFDKCTNVFFVLYCTLILCANLALVFEELNGKVDQHSSGLMAFFIPAFGLIFWAFTAFFVTLGYKVYTAVFKKNRRELDG